MLENLACMILVMLMYYDVTIGGCVAASRCLYDNCTLLEIT